MTFEQDSELLCKAMVDLIQVNDSVFMINEGKGVERDDFIDKTYFINVYGKYCYRILNAFLEKGNLEIGQLNQCITTIDKICNLHKYNKSSFIGDNFASHLEFGLLSHPNTHIAKKLRKILSKKSFEVIKVYSRNVYGY